MKTLKWGLLYTAAFLAAFVGSALLKMNSDPTHGKYNTRWDETVGKVYTDLPYGEGAANKFDLYVPADKSQDAYGLVVYLHAGGFTSGDKAGDAEMLKWLPSMMLNDLHLLDTVMIKRLVELNQPLTYEIYEKKGIQPVKKFALTPQKMKGRAEYMKMF